MTIAERLMELARELNMKKTSSNLLFIDPETKRPVVVTPFGHRPCRLETRRFLFFWKRTVLVLE